MNAAIFFITGVSGLLGGVKHQFFSGPKSLFGSFIWLVTCIAVYPLFTVNFLTVIFTLKPINFENFKRKWLKPIVIFTVLISIEEAVYEIISMGKLMVFGTIICSIIQVFSCFKGYIPFKKFMYFSGVFSLLIFGVVFSKYRDDCIHPYAFEKHGCPFPDHFNHNACMHVVTFFAFFCMTFCYKTY